MTTDNKMDVSMDVDAEAVSLLQREGLNVSKMSSSTNDAFRMATVYHAYDGRAIKVPVYMVDPSEGDSLLKRVFTSADKDAPPEYIGKRVWYLKEQPTIRPEGTVRCLFSYYNDDAEKAKMLTEGFESNCRNKTKFPTRFEMDNHMRLRHPRRYNARTKFELEKSAEKQAASAENNTEALMLLISELLKSQAKAPAKKATE